MPVVTPGDMAYLFDVDTRVHGGVIMIKEHERSDEEERSRAPL